MRTFLLLILMLMLLAACTNTTAQNADEPAQATTTAKHTDTSQTEQHGSQPPLQQPGTLSATTQGLTDTAVISPTKQAGNQATTTPTPKPAPSPTPTMHPRAIREARVVTMTEVFYPGDIPTHTPTPQPAIPRAAVYPGSIPQLEQSTDAESGADTGIFPEAGALATGAEPIGELAQIAAAHRVPHDRVMLAKALGNKAHIQEVARILPLQVQVGDVESFWVSNLALDKNHVVTAELRYAGPVVLMYVEQGLQQDQATLEETAKTFEEEIYPFTRYLFGSEWQPGVDGDSRITILNVSNQGDSAIGYFSARDSTPKRVNRYSNEREMFYMKIPPGNPIYLPTLAHEFQHMIHWNEQRGSATWFQEGCAKLSEDLNGYGNDSFVGIYLRNPDTQLNAWSQDSPTSHAHYGAANLFMRYMYAHYTGQQGLAQLVREDASNNLDAFVRMAARVRPDITSFSTLFGDWTVANLLNDLAIADGRYTYDLQAGMRRLPGGLALLSSTVITSSVSPGNFSDTVAQFGADYLMLPQGPQTITFTGNLTVDLIGTKPKGKYAWWSGRGDNNMAMLTHPIDLRGISEDEQITLQFATWFEMETEYDYAFVTVSADGGETWETLPGTFTREDDPQGANYGHGLTGVSGSPQAQTKTGSNVRGEWVTEEMNLSAYAGKEILLRFWQVNDEAYHAPGMLLDNIRVCPADAGDSVDGDDKGDTAKTEGEGKPADNNRSCFFTDDGEAGDTHWQAEGFVRVDGDLPQQWELRLVRTNVHGTTSVVSLPVDAATGMAQASLAEGEQAVLIVAGTTPHTTEKASYQLHVQPIE